MSVRTAARVLAALAVDLSVLTTNVWAQTKARPLQAPGQENLLTFVKVQPYIED